MSERLDACVPRARGDRTYWVKIGAAWPNKNGPGYQVVLDALPIPDDKGRVVINLFVPKSRDEKPQQSGGDKLDDEIPF